jgi:membrane protease YdiL (CAAX protease family)
MSDWAGRGPGAYVLWALIALFVQSLFASVVPLGEILDLGDPVTSFGAIAVAAPVVGWSAVSWLRRTWGQPLAVIGLGPPPRTVDAWAWTAVAAIVAVLLPQWVAGGLEALDAPVWLYQQSYLEEVGRVEGPVAIGIVVLAALLAAPFIEELIHRGLGMLLCAPFGPKGAALATAFLFAALHWKVGAVVPVFALGLLLAWVRLRTGTLWACIAVHAIFNAVGLVERLGGSA